MELNIVQDATCTLGESELYPSFGSVKEILVIKDEKFFAIQPLKSLLF